jgi:hypothetical protein
MLEPDTPVAIRAQALLATTTAIIGRSAAPCAIFVVAMAGLGSLLDISGQADGSGGTFALNAAGLAAGFFLSLAMLARSGLMLEDGRSRFGAYFGLSLLSGVGILAGLILLLMPGLVLLIRWLPAFGFLLGSHQGVRQSLSSSWRRTRGHFWALLAGAAVPFLIAATGGTLYFVVEANVAVPSEVLFVLANLAIYAFTVVWSAYGFAAYALLRDDMDELSEVFG